MELGPEDNLLEDEKQEEADTKPSTSVFRTDSSFSFSSTSQGQSGDEAENNDPDGISNPSLWSSSTAADDLVLDAYNVSGPSTADEVVQRLEIESEGNQPDEDIYEKDALNGDQSLPAVSSPLEIAEPNTSIASMFGYIEPNKKISSRHSDTSILSPRQDKLSSESNLTPPARHSLAEIDEIRLSLDANHLFSPQEVRKRISSMKKERKTISLVTRQSTDDDISRARSHSDEMTQNAVRRKSTHARLEGNLSTENFYLKKRLSEDTPSSPQLSVHFSHFEKCNSPIASNTSHGHESGQSNRALTRASISMGHFSRYWHSIYFVWTREFT